jgi:hypothetical protein
METVSTTEYLSPHTQSLITRGIAMGTLHVLAGPDHLSALATLSAGSSYKAFAVGIRWGLGHSSGLIVITVVFIYLKGDLDLRKIGRFGDFLVGIFMLMIGLYSAYTAVKANSNRIKKRNKDGEEDMSTPSFCCAREALDHDASDTLFCANTRCSQCNFLQHVELKDPHSQRVLAFIIGIVHGVAGPGAILGVLPAVEMQNWQSSCIYLSSFIITSTLSMGTFAALYGELSKRIGSTAECVELLVSLFSASLSIGVGILWITLSYYGKLNAFFH